MTGVRRAREAEERSSLRARELAGVDRLSHQLLDAGIRRRSRGLLLAELAELFRLDLAHLALVEDEGRTARIVATRDRGNESELLLGEVISLEHEASGIGTVVREGAGFAVFDAETSPTREQAPERDRAGEELRLRPDAGPRRGHRRRLRRDARAPRSSTSASWR